MPETFNLIDPATGDAVEVTEAELPAYLSGGFRFESPEAAASRTSAATIQEQHSGLRDKAVAAAAGVARGATFGLSDLALRAADQEYAEQIGRVREANPTVSLVSEIAGGVAPGLATGGTGALGSVARATPAGAVAGLGARLARTAPEAGALARIGRGAAGGFVEGGLQAAGTVISDHALAADPLAIDRIASDMTSRFLYGGLVGGVSNASLRGLEVSLGAARRRLVQARDAVTKVDDIPEDLAGLDRKGLRAAQEAELAAIEAQRVPQRAQLATEINAFREATKLEQPWVAVATGAKKGVKADPATAPRWMRETGKLALESDRALDRVLRNPKRLAEAPQAAKAALQQQEHALELILDRADELRVLHAADTTGRRAAALDQVPRALERNRELQRRIDDLVAAPSTPRLAAITDAVDALGTARTKTLGEQMASGAAYGMAADLVRSVPFVGGLAAPLVGARIADMVAGKVGGQLAAATRQATERAVAAVDAFLTVTKGAQRVAPRVAPVVASKVLEAVRFAPRPREDEPAKKRSIEESFDERVAELGESVMPGPDGRPMVRPEARAKIAERLEPIAAFAPHVADQLETRAVRRLELIARKAPRSTAIGMVKLRPSEMAIRAWARYIAAADDPGGIEERLADGTVTPEDAEVMRELYPDRMAEITRMIMERLPALRASLPYHRRLALSIFTGAPVDPAMDPQILAVLQAQFDQEPNTEGGVQAPRPQPAFGSVKKSVPSPTPAQERAG